MAQTIILASNGFCDRIRVYGGEYDKKSRSLCGSLRKREI